MRRGPLARHTALRAGSKRLQRRVPPRVQQQPKRRGQGISPASAAQRAKVRGKRCVVCERRDQITPMHLVDRSLGGCSEPQCVVPGCWECHRLYENGQLDLLPFLEPQWRTEQSHAVLHLGVGRAYRKLTGRRDDGR